MLYYGFGEQARHEHMLDEYKDRYITITLLKTPPWYYTDNVRDTSGSHRTEQEGDLIRHD